MNQVLKPKKGYYFVKWYYRKQKEIPNDWKVLTLDSVLNRLENGLVYKHDKNKKTGFPITRIETISHETISEDNVGYVESISEDELHKYSLQKGNILFSHINSLKHVGKIATYQGSPKLLLHGMNLLRITVNDKKMSSEFLYYVLKFSPTRERLRTISNRAINQVSINTTQLKKFLLVIPSISEQQKIANILSNADELITSTQKIIEQTKSMKKGLMQRLLVNGIGHTKFKKVKWNYGKLLEIPEDWNIVLLDTIAKRGSGHTPDIKNPEFYNGGIKWVSLADSYRLDNVYITETTKEISQKGIENSSAVKHPSGVVILSRDAGVGKSAITKTEMAVSQHFMVWQCGENLNNYFLYYLLQFWKPFFESIAIGTTIPTIGLPFFKKFKIIFPQKIEQDKIALILSNIDFQIQSQIQYKEKLELLKKSLMQKLLTGQVRVTV